MEGQQKYYVISVLMSVNYKKEWRTRRLRGTARSAVENRHDFASCRIYGSCTAFLAAPQLSVIQSNKGEKMACKVVWKHDSHIFISEEMNRKMAQSLVDDLRNKFGIDAEIVGCGE